MTDQTSLNMEPKRTKRRSTRTQQAENLGPNETRKKDNLPSTQTTITLAQPDAILTPALPPMPTYAAHAYPDLGPSPSPLPLPPISGELTPSPPTSPSPAPEPRNNHLGSKVNRMMDMLTPNTSIHPHIPENRKRKAQDETAIATPHNAGPQTPTTSTYSNASPGISTGDSLPQADQITAAANLRYQARPKRGPIRDPLDKYNKNITTQIHDAHPDSIFERIDPRTFPEWESLAGRKLLIIPFENEAQNPNHHEETSRAIFAAVAEITTSSDLGVASAHPNEEGRRRGRMPMTFMVYNLNDEHYQILMQQTVWASQKITFRVTTTSMKCPSFLFTIQGLRTLEPNSVRNSVREIWNNDDTQAFFNQGISSYEGEARERATQAIQAFMDSMWTTRLDMRDQGGTLKPAFNIYADGSIIDNVGSWVNIRAHLANQNYQSTTLGKGQAEIAPYHCSLCHGADHPRGLCPFPAVEGWKGPKRRLTLTTTRRNASSNNRTRPSLSGWN